MSDKIEIKTLNGHPLVDSTARAEIETLKKNGGSGGSGGAGVVFVRGVIVAPINDTEFSITTEMNHAECATAYASGCMLFFRIDMDGTGHDTILTAVTITDEDITFGVYLGGVSIMAHIEKDGEHYLELILPQ